MPANFVPDSNPTAFHSPYKSSANAINSDTPHRRRPKHTSALNSTNSSPLQSIVITFIALAGSCCSYAFGASRMLAECSLYEQHPRLAKRPSRIVRQNFGVGQINLAVLTPPDEVRLASAAGLFVLFLIKRQDEFSLVDRKRVATYVQIGSRTPSSDVSPYMTCIGP